MKKYFYLLVSLSMLSGCTVDLRSGNKFEGFIAPPEDKARVYLVRDDNAFAAKPPYKHIYATEKGVEFNIFKLNTDKHIATIGKGNFVSILLPPGDLSIVSWPSRNDFTFKAGEVRCIDIGNKFRGITVSVVEEISLGECEKLLKGVDEGVSAEVARSKKAF